MLLGRRSLFLGLRGFRLDFRFRRKPSRQSERIPQFFDRYFLRFKQSEHIFQTQAGLVLYAVHLIYAICVTAQHGELHRSRDIPFFFAVQAHAVRTNAEHSIFKFFQEPQHIDKRSTRLKRYRNFNFTFRTVHFASR